jgi:hypothetical protein
VTVLFGMEPFEHKKFVPTMLALMIGSAIVILEFVVSPILSVTTTE